MTRARNILASCCDCGSTFNRRVTQEWRIRCLPCWRKSKGLGAPAVTPTADPVRDELREIVPGLTRLAHPERHGGSALANGTTALLLDVPDWLGGA